MGNAQYDFQKGVDPLNENTKMTKYSISLPNDSKVDTMKNLLKKTLHKDGTFFNQNISTQIISNNDEATTFLTSKEIGEAFLNTFNWVMGDVKAELSMFPVSEGLYYLIALNHFEDAKRVVDSDFERVWNIKSSRIIEKKVISEYYPFLKMVCKAPGTSKEIIAKKSPASKKLKEYIQKMEKYHALNESNDHIVQQQIGTKFDDLPSLITFELNEEVINVELVGNSRRLFVISLIQQYNHSLHELTEALELTCFSCRFDLSIIIIKAITSLFRSNVEAIKAAKLAVIAAKKDAAAAIEKAAREEKQPPTPPPLPKIPEKVFYNDEDQEILHNCIAMICGKYGNDNSDDEKKEEKKEEEEKNNEEEQLRTIKLKEELRFHCFHMLMNSTCFKCIDVNRSEKETNVPPLYHAVTSDDIRMIQLLLNMNTIDLYNSDTNQHLPPIIYTATYCGNEEVLQLLIPLYNSTTRNVKDNVGHILMKDIKWGQKNKTPLNIAEEKKLSAKILTMLGKPDPPKPKPLPKPPKPPKPRIPYHGKEHKLLVDRLIFILKTDKKSIKFCDDVFQMKKKNGKWKKDSRILVVEDEILITLVKNADKSISKSKEFATSTLSSVERDEKNIITFKAAENKDIDKIKIRKFDCVNDLEADELYHSLLHCMKYTEHQMYLKSQKKQEKKKEEEEEEEKEKEKEEKKKD